jgi:glycosyltransferase involved in cell wall biosynthesis
MDLISNYKEDNTSDASEPSEIKNLLYLAKPIYGGWVTFTAHLSHKYNAPIYKIASRNEKSDRDFGYDCKYRNLSINEVITLKNIVITAVDKHYWEYLHLFPPETQIVIHDPTECKKSKNCNPLVQSTDHNDKPLLEYFRVITIRESVQEYLMNVFSIPSQFMPHPFFSYKIPTIDGLGYKCVSIARIDFDKNTDILLKANALLENKSDHIYLFGAENRLYVHHKLKELNIEEFWKGKFPKNLSPTFQDKSILKDAKYMIDMSIIKGDGGGTQYTFLEAIHQDTVLILHNDWIDAGSTFQSGHNCIGVSSAEELAEFIKKDLSSEEYSKILMNGKKILEKHV